MVAGTVRWKRYLDYLILSLCSNDKLFREMEPLLLQVSYISIEHRSLNSIKSKKLSTLWFQILRIGFFEILKLEVPAYAAADEV
jgi:16S rRNA (cytosine967-C5)-methyltransferase